MVLPPSRLCDKRWIAKRPALLFSAGLAWVHQLVFSKNRFGKVKQDIVVTIYLGALLSGTTIFNNVLRDSGMASLDDRVTCNQMLVKVSIFIL